MTVKNRASESRSAALRETSATDLIPENADFGRAHRDVAKNTSLLGHLPHSGSEETTQPYDPSAAVQPVRFNNTRVHRPFNGEGVLLPLTQTQLASAVADRAEISRNEAKRVLGALEEIVLEELGNAQRFASAVSCS